MQERAGELFSSVPCLGGSSAHSSRPQIPNYSFVLHQRTEETTYLYGAAVIIIEGLFVLHDKAIRDVLDLKVFVQVRMMPALRPHVP